MHQNWIDRLRLCQCGVALSCFMAFIDKKEIHILHSTFPAVDFDDTAAK